jgi:hypothetical protein
VDDAPAASHRRGFIVDPRTSKDSCEHIAVVIKPRVAQALGCGYARPEIANRETQAPPLEVGRDIGAVTRA